MQIFFMIEKKPQALSFLFLPAELRALMQIWTHILFCVSKTVVKNKALISFGRVCIKEGLINGSDTQRSAGTLP